jgi:hypothetical protein
MDGVDLYKALSFKVHSYWIYIERGIDNKGSHLLLRCLNNIAHMSHDR